MVEKAAKARSRSPRKDPDQETIVRSKDAINERTSKLIRLLIELKRGWNGNPAPGIGVPEKYNLTQPMPDEVVSTGDAALQELTNIIQALRQIDNMQDTYSATRTQRIGERMKQMQELQQQAQAAAVKAELCKEASSRLSRLWTYVVAPFSTEKGKWDRVSLLKALARVNSNLKDVEDSVLSGDPAILESLYVAKQLYLDAKGSFFEEFRKNLTNMLHATSKELAQLDKEIKVELAKQKERARTESGDDRPLGGPREVPTPKPKEPKKTKKDKKVEETLTEMSEQVDQARTTVEQTIEEQRELMGPRGVPVEEALTSGLPKDEEKEAPPAEETPPAPEPEPEPAPDPKQAQRALREFIMNKAISMYRDTGNKILGPNKDPAFENMPQYWLNRIRTQWSTVNEAAQQMNEGLPIKTLSMNYLTLVKAIGDLVASESALRNEKIAQEQDPNFQFGSTVDEGQLENQARQYVEFYYNDLQKIVSQASEINSLVVHGSSLSRWIKRTLTELSWKRDKHLRLQASHQIRQARKNLQPMMDNLEKRNINFRSLINQSELFYDSFIQVYDKLADLAESYNARMRIEKSKRKVQKERMKYDLIPSTDINAMRGISRVLRSDRDSVKMLGSIEDNVSKAQAYLDKLRETGIQLDVDIPGKEESSAQTGEM